MSHKSPRTILIPGASKGIGHACALAFAGCGDKLILVARSADKLQEAAEQCRNVGAALFCCFLQFIGGTANQNKLVTTTSKG